MRDHRTLEAWKEARIVTLLVLKHTREHWRPWSSALHHQLQRSSLSVQLNIAEGYSYGLSRSYVRFLGIAFGSIVETIEVVELMKDAGALPADAADIILARAVRCRRLLVGILKQVRPIAHSG